MSRSLGKKNYIFLLFILIALIFRLILSFLPAFEIDQSAYRYFSSKLTDYGLERFYSAEGTNLNALGYFYPLWIIGLIKKNFFPGMNFFSRDYDILLKIPANLTDIATGILIYFLIQKKLDKNWGILGFLMYVFNPAIFFNSSIWGQYDSISAFFLVLSLLSLIKKNTILMASFFAIALTFKPQAIFFAPIAVAVTLTTIKPARWLLALCSFLFTTLLIYLPFFPQNPFYGIYFVNSNLANTYSCTSCFALNFWGIFGNWKNDMSLFLNIPLLYWGFLLLLGSLVIIFGVKKLKGDILYFTISISMLAFFMLLTRMHERYISYFFPFLLLAAMFLKSKILGGFYIFFSLISLLNLYVVYAYYNNAANITNLPVNYLFTIFNNLSFVSFLGFALFFIYYLKYVKQN